MNTHKPPLDRAAVIALLERRGGDLSQLPQPEREAAQALIAANPELAALQQQASELDALLDAVPAPIPSASLRRAVAEIPLRHPQPQKSPWLGLFELFGAGALGQLRIAASFVVALGAGWSAGHWLDGGQDPTVAATGLAATGDPMSTAQRPVGTPAEQDEATLEESLDQTQDVTADESWEAFAALAFADGLTLDPMSESEDSTGETL